MAKTITFTYEGKDFTLEFTKRTIKLMEEAGFVAGDIDRRPMTLLPQLFAGAFLAHHRFVRQETIDAIYAAMPNKEDLVGKLAEMYQEPIRTLMEEPEGELGNVDWKASW